MGTWEFEDLNLVLKTQVIRSRNLVARMNGGRQVYFQPTIRRITPLYKQSRSLACGTIFQSTTQWNATCNETLANGEGATTSKTSSVTATNLHPPEGTVA